MDTQKIGVFLKALRKEKGLTQEQLAEAMSISRRTVSRWETGSNLPDLDLLVALSDFYQTDLRALLNGERSDTQMNPELRETVKQVADYSSEEKSRLMRSLHRLLVAGLIAFAAFVLITALGADDRSPWEAISGFGLGFALAMNLLGAIFTSRHALSIRAMKLGLLGRGKENKKCTR